MTEWRYLPDYEAVATAEGEMIADLFGKDKDKNGHLIAAAPKMYALLDKCESALRHWLSGSIDEPMIGETENTINEIRGLLAEARGER